ncbi:Uncharacterized iron-regulated protein [Catalinimonas alkaloidigena]|uniref:Uncharacterized iron-regulated protein n=1 Tax=Catalinimonas alkaloidigena TaxID=1075417 RepID=A0A1G8XKI6_9BACT|nr:ChaN family lipoprotein [Catalinimonas alkaloidigena]SDJ91172.1 Uncharacterized iron-regulated protein [Catalinimonas alkaloidigena]
MKTLFRLVCLSLLLVSTASTPPMAYRWFNAQGEPAAWETLVSQAAAADVVLFGELHNNAIAHWFQVRLLQELHAQHGNQLVLGAEMFEADDQVVLDEYLAGWITDQHLATEAKLWKNYATDYRPLVDYAKEHTLPFVATNIPRRYASLVARQGLPVLDSLSAEARRWIAPLPLTIDPELPGYRQMREMMGGAHGSNADQMVAAQAIKDATMAHFIAQHRHAGQTFLHFNGAYHSDRHEGIGWYLRQTAPTLKILTISTVEQSQLDSLAQANQQVADFVLVVPDDMTKTH